MKTKYLFAFAFFTASFIFQGCGASFKGTPLPIPASIFFQPASFRLAIAPFYCPANRDYGVYMADRIAYELHRRSYLPVLGRARFVLIETDVPTKDIAQANKQLSPALHEFLRQRGSRQLSLDRVCRVYGHL